MLAAIVRTERCAAIPRLISSRCDKVNDERERDKSGVLDAP